MMALLAAKRAGEAILEVYDSDFTVEHKDDKSPLTLADKRSHEIIMNDLKNAININNTTVPILSEEGKVIPYDERKKWEYFWLVDPLDGTKEFVKRNGEFTVNIALVHRNSPVLGIIYIPVKGTFYYAAINLGTYKLVNSEIITDNLSIKELIDKSQKLPLNDRNNFPLTLIGSRSHATAELSEFTKRMNEKYGKVEFMSAGSSLKFCLIAEGKADVYPRFGPTMEWDTAAGQAIVEHAKGKVIDIQTKEPLRYNKNDLLNPFFIVSSQSFSASQLVC
ncbi:MAG: cysteine biosynthesis protein CysQ [Candidatus Scalindua rubra]|uniref:3'(2'),5'-bisphosphate nucleotidase CysQ n=1 Tax=Candidatus Scalindua rubra TaxID=1872076 RepID=A0A1E3X7I5_9BACT|nr:MAG: cysteine biosynthesis protein CysQ [Candidatus Scalindua rubra]